MQHTQAASAPWIQLDAGIWTKPARSGRVEICFASDMDGTPLYDVIAYDASGRRSDAYSPADTFRDFLKARSVGDDLAEQSISTSNRLN